MKSDKISRLVTENINLIYLVMKRFRNRGVRPGGFISDRSSWADKGSAAI